MNFRKPLRYGRRLGFQTLHHRRRTGPILLGLAILLEFEHLHVSHNACLMIREVVRRSFLVISVCVGRLVRDDDERLFLRSWFK